MVSRFDFSYVDSDLTLFSGEESEPTKFQVYKCILAVSSPFFRNMFSLPQTRPEPGEPENTFHPTTVPMPEGSSIIQSLLEFIYPVEDPTIENLNELVPVLTSAAKYDMTSVVRSLGKILLLPQFVEKDPIRVYAIAVRFEMEGVMKEASRHSLRVDILEAPVSADLKYITAETYARLLAFRQQRAKAAVMLLRYSKDIWCSQCENQGYYQPNWWPAFTRKATEELRLRPTTEKVFSMNILVETVVESGRNKCMTTMMTSWYYLESIKRKIDALPSTM